MHTVSRFAALAAALALSACAAGPPVCAPNLGDSAAQLQRRCGTPAAVYRAESDALTQEEWQYGDVYIGLIAGSVAYVLK